MYWTEEGLVGLPLSAFPASVFYRPELFDRAGLNHPPKYYGERYQLPDGTEYDWNWGTFSYVARLLTVDVNGLNATEYGFDASQIIQYGYEPQWQSARQMTSFFGGQKLYNNGNSAIPWEARTAWKTYYDGMWGPQPFIPSGSTHSSAEFGSGNVFNSGRVGMSITEAWYLCCMGNILNTGGTFDFGALPSFNGAVYSLDSEVNQTERFSLSTQILRNSPSVSISEVRVNIIATTGLSNWKPWLGFVLRERDRVRHGLS